MVKTILAFNLLFFVFIGTTAKRGSHPGLKLPSLVPGHLVVRYDFLNQCENGSRALILKSYHFVDLGVENGHAIDCDLKVLRQIPTIKKFLFVIDICDNRAYSRCEHFQNWKLGEEACSMWSQKNVPWNTVYNSYRPPINCPVTPGDYTSKNASVSMEAVERLPFPLEKHFWKIRMMGYDPSLFMCYEIGIHFLRTRG